MKWIDVILALITLGAYTLMSIGIYKNDKGDEIFVLIGCTILLSFLFLFTLRAVLGFGKK